MKISGKYLLKTVENEHFLIPLNETGLDLTKSLMLNEIGYIVYQGISNGLSSEQIINNILAEYTVDYATVSNDVNSFINLLKEKEVIV